METSTSNGTKADLNNSNTTSKKRKNPRYLPSLPIASSAKDTNKGSLYLLVSKTPEEFAAIDNYQLFSTVDDGSDPMIKISRSKAARLSDGRPFPTGGGRVYRIRISGYLPEDNQDS